MSDGRKLRIVVLGTGSAGMRHVRAFGVVPGVEVCAVPVRPERIEVLRGEGIDARTLEDAIGAGFDGAVVATDTGRHESDTLRLLEFSPVLIEKPPAPTLTAAIRIAQRAAALGRPAHVAFCLRFDAGLIWIRRHLEGLGRLHLADVECLSWLPDWRPGRDPRLWYAAREGEGGVLLDLTHEIDYCGWLFGAVRRVRATLGNRGIVGLPPSVEETAILFGEYDSGLAVTIRLSYAVRPRTRRLRVWGDRGVLEWDGDGDLARWIDGAGAEVESLKGSGRASMYEAQARAWIGHLRGKRSDQLVDIGAGAAVVAICDAARESSFRAEAVAPRAIAPARTAAVASADRYRRSRELEERAHRAIPGGSHTYSKGSDQFPIESPGFIDRAEGSVCWDVDGNRFLDWGMGLRSVILGHAYPRVLAAVRAELVKGVNFTRPSPIELTLAELLMDTIPSAQMVKLAKNGSDVTSAAVRLARAHTGRDYVVRCREQPFFSFGDWFIGSTVCSAGVPQAVRDLTLQFGYNDAASLERLFEAHPDRIAAVILEAATTDPPASGFLEAVREITRREGAVLIFDEMITGFRWHLRGAQAMFGVTPDLSTFGKGVGNGFSVTALVGRRDIMERGGIRHPGDRVFLLSATHGGETHAVAAALATVAELREKNVVEHIWAIGRKLQDGFNAVARGAGIERQLQMIGYPCSPVIVCRDDRETVSLPFRTLFLQEMIARGVLIPYVAPSYAHRGPDVEQTLEAARGAAEVYRRALDDRSVDRFLHGPVVRHVFRETN